MKIPKLIRVALLALASLALAPRGATAAGTTTYTDGDLFLGFRATGETQDYLINIGQPGSLSTGTVANVASQLKTTFGDNWYDRTDLFFGIIGGNTLGANGDPANTVYATRSISVPWPQLSDGAAASATTLLSALGNTFAHNTASSAGNTLVQKVGSNNSYASFQPGGTSQNSGGISFSTFGPSNEGTPKTLLYLDRVTPSSVATGVVRVGTVSLAASGDVTFSPAPAVGSSQVQFEQPLATVGEQDGQALVKVIRYGDSTAAFDVTFDTSNGTAQGGTDFTPKNSFLVSFGANQTQANVSVPVADVPGYQGSRSFSATLSNPTAGVALGSPSTVSVTITDNEIEPAGTISFAASTAQTTQLDPNGGTKLVTIPLTRTGGANGAVSVDVAATGGTLDSSLFTVNSPVTFAAGATTADVEVQLNAIDPTTLPGTIQLTLSNPQGSDPNNLPTLGGQTTNTLTVSASATVAFTSATYSVPELNGVDNQLMISVTRSDSAGAASVEVAVTGGTAGPADFSLPATPVVLSWADGETGIKSFTFTVKHDTLVEGPETVQLTLQNATGSVAPAGITVATVTIIDSDSTAPVLTVVSPKANAAVTGAGVTVSGKVTDASGVGRVEVQVNGVLALTLTPASATTSFDYTGTIIPEQGANTVTVTAFDIQENATAPITRSIRFTNVRPALVGNYNGLIIAGLGAAPIDFNGLLNIDVTATGVFTGKITVHGVALPLSGTVLTTGELRFGPTKTATKDLTQTVSRVVNHFGELALVVEPGANRITGTIKDVPGTTTLATVPHADQALYNTTTNKVPQSIYDALKEKGKYTALFQSELPDNNNTTNNGYTSAQFPQGDGYSTVTVTTAGVVKFVGKLADGSAVSYSNTLSKANTLPVFLSLYTAQGLLTGDVAFDSTKLQTDATSPGMHWYKPDGLLRQANYPHGWPNGITVDLVASKFITPVKPTAAKPVQPNPDTAFGAGVASAVPPAANFTVSLANGNLSAATSDDLSISGLNTIKVVTAAASAPSLKVTVTTTTGLLGGSFKHPLTGVVTPLVGVAFQKTNAAGGYFLSTIPVKNPPIQAVPQSGSVTLLKK